MRDGEDFAHLLDPYRLELLQHCYRMLDSVVTFQDAGLLAASGLPPALVPAAAAQATRR